MLKLQVLLFQKMSRFFIINCGSLASLNTKTILRSTSSVGSTSLGDHLGCWSIETSYAGTEVGLRVASFWVVWRERWRVHPDIRQVNDIVQNAKLWAPNLAVGLYASQEVVMVFDWNMCLSGMLTFVKRFGQVEKTFKSVI